MSTQPVVVIGMHRSGTSLAAALLESAGLDIGQRLMEGNWSNPRGHFEDMDFIELQRDALVRLGLHQDGWLTSELPEPAAFTVDRARALVAERQQSDRPWGWKDPRTVLFLPLWLSLVPGATFAIVYRAPWEVIESLYRRGDPILLDDPESAIRIWRHYNRTLLDLARALPGQCLLVNADTIAANPAAWVAAVAARCGLPLGAPDAAICEPALMHGSEARDRAGLILRHYPQVVELFGMLEDRAFRPAGLGAPALWTSSLSAEAEARLAMRDWYRSCAASVERERVKADMARALAALDAGGDALEDAKHAVLKTASRMSQPLGATGWLV